MQGLATRARRGLIALLVAVAMVEAAGFACLVAGGVLGDAASNQDFLCFYVAGRAVSHGAAAQLYDWTRLAALFGPITGQDTAHFLPWLYPPSLLLLLQPLAALPLGAAHLAWSLGTLGLFAAVLWAVAGPLAALAALACPLVLAEAVMGQTGFLNAALLGGALLLAERRPALAGLLAGLLACKPQLDLMLPLMLLATRNWRALLAAGLTLLATTLLSAWLYGAASWAAFAASLHLDGAALAEGRLVPWWALESLYGLLRRAGAPQAAAASAQGLVALAAAGVVVHACVRPAPQALRAACVALATALASPYLLLWDLTLLALAMAFLARLGRGQPRPAWQGAAFLALGAAPLLPLACRVPVGVPCCGVLAALVLSHLRPSRLKRPRRGATPADRPALPSEAQDASLLRSANGGA